MKILLNLTLILLFNLITVYSPAQNRSKLHEPAGRGDLDQVKKMIEKGAKVDKKDTAGQTALMYAAESGKLDVVTYLIEQGANVNAISGKMGRGTPLIYAAAANQIETVEYLLEHGANINSTTPYHHETALIWAVGNGNIEIVKLLLEHGADKTIKTKEGDGVMDLAKKLNREDILTLLEEK